MRHLFLFLLVSFLLVNLTLSGQDTHYPVAAIDSSLLKNASVVVRVSERIIEVNSLHSETITTRIVLTILKESGLSAAYSDIHYDNWTDINRFEGTIYDAGGKLIKALEKKDLRDHSAIDDGLLYSDERVRSYRPVIAEFPVTIEYFIKQTFRRMLVYPAWSPQSSFNTSVESARLEIHTDKGRFPRYKALRIPGDAIVTGDGTETRTWELKNLPAITDEPLNPPFTELAPIIYLTPKTYAVKGYSGDFSTWKSYGEWAASLNEERDTLSAAMYEKVFNLVRNTMDKKERVKIIYQYMQSTCRYVAVAIGISGIQPEKAETVARLGYGDCKGLVNYTKALLKTAGIPSFYTLVQSGKNAEAIQEDFPGDQFNHIILCVPLDKDTVWLECTGMKMPFGFLGDFTDDRAVLVVTPQGGLLTRTPAYKKEQNTSSRITRLTIDSTGNAAGTIRSIYAGLQFSRGQSILYLGPEDQRKALRNHYDVPGVTFSAVSFSSFGDELPGMVEKLNVSIQKFSPVSGNRMFITLNRFLDNPGTFSRDDNRKYDVVITFPYIDADTVVINIPRGYKIENRPGKVELKSQFGLLKSEVTVDGQTLTLYRHFELEKGRYPALQYNEFVEFLRQVAKQDKSKVVIVKG